MRIKNVSSTKIDLQIQDSQYVLQPGDIKDLSQFDTKDLHTHKRLNMYFDKGLLINLGSASPKNSLAQLKSARERINKMGLSGYVAKQSKKTTNPNNRSKITELLKKSSSRNFSEPEFDSSRERHGDEYYQNMNPNKPREQYDQPKPRPTFQDDFPSMQINPDGTITEFGSYGNIPTKQLTGETTALNQPLQSQPEKIPDQIVVTDKQGYEYTVSVKQIEKKIKSKCLAFTSSSKPCKKLAVRGFQTCLTHMSASEKKQYKKIKSSPNS